MNNITFKDLSQRPDYPVAFRQSAETLRSYWTDTNEVLDVSVGSALEEILLRPNAETYTLERARWRAFRDAGSLAAIEADPEMFDNEDADRMLSNFRVTRRTGDTATGEVTVTVSRESVIGVEEGARFVVSNEGESASTGVEFITRSPYVISAGASVTANNRPMVQGSDGYWRFTVPVVAVAPGAQYQIRAGTTLVWVSPPDSYVSAQADGDFTEASGPETNRELLRRLNVGLSAPGLAGAINIEALVRRYRPGVIDVSVIGANNSELFRATSNVLGIPVGGLTDIYLRSAVRTQSMIIQKTATLIGGSSYTLSVTRDDFPGFYYVRNIRLADGTVIQQDSIATSKGFDITDDPDAPKISSALDAGFSRYQTAILTFMIPSAQPPAAVDCQVELVGLPGIADVQRFLMSRGVRNPNGDYLVRAPIPCIASFNLHIERRFGGNLPDLDAVKQAVVTATEAARFTDGKVSAAQVVAAVQEVLPDRCAVVLPLSVFTRFHRPDGETVEQRVQGDIIAPYQPSFGVSPNTSCVFTDISSVSITLTDRN